MKIGRKKIGTSSFVLYGLLSVLLVALIALAVCPSPTEQVVQLVSGAPSVKQAPAKLWGSTGPISGTELVAYPKNGDPTQDYHVWRAKKTFKGQYVLLYDLGKIEPEKK